MEKQQIKVNYYNLISRGQHPKWVEEAIDTTAKQCQYYEILEELLDVSKSKVEGLTEEQTDTIRKYIGIYGKEETVADIAVSTGKTFTQVSKIVNDAAYLFRIRVLRGCADFKKSVLDGELTLDDILEMKLGYIFWPDNVKVLNCMNKSGRSTIKDVIETPISELAKCRYIGKKGLHDLVGYMHGIGLAFKDKDPFFTKAFTEDKKNIVKTLEHIGEIRYKINELLKEVKKVSIEQEECNKIISEQTNKKQQLELKKQQLLEAIKGLQEANSKEKTIGKKEC